MILVSPAEPASYISALSRLARPEEVVTSSVPESRGSDYLFPARGLWVGIQRKTISDLVASVRDGRLQREVPLLLTCSEALLLVEGIPYEQDGHLDLHGKDEWTVASFRSLLRSVARRGILVEQVNDLWDFAGRVLEVVTYYRKPDHKTLAVRPKANLGDAWGQKVLEATWSWILQGFPGVGPSLAETIVAHFSACPLTWTCTEEELRAVPGLGPKRIKELLRVLRPSDPTV